MKKESISCNVFIKVMNFILTFIKILFDKICLFLIAFFFILFIRILLNFLTIIDIEEEMVNHPERIRWQTADNSVHYWLPNDRIFSFRELLLNGGYVGIRYSGKDYISTRNLLPDLRTTEPTIRLSTDDLLSLHEPWYKILRYAMKN